MMIHRLPREGTAARESAREAKLQQHETDITRLLRRSGPARPIGSGEPIGAQRFGQQVPVLLAAPLYVGNAASGEIYTWNGSAWVATGSSQLIDPTFVRGYFAASDYLLAEWFPQPVNRWIGKGTGRTTIYGTLGSQVATGSSGTLSERDKSGTLTGTTITAWNGPESWLAIPSGGKVTARWSDEDLAWIVAYKPPSVYGTFSGAIADGATGSFAVTGLTAVSITVTAMGDCTSGENGVAWRMEVENIWRAAQLCP